MAGIELARLLDMTPPQVLDTFGSSAKRVSFTTTATGQSFATNSTATPFDESEST